MKTKIYMKSRQRRLKERIQKGKDKDKYKVKGMDSVLNGDYMYLGYKPCGVLKAMVAQR